MLTPLISVIIPNFNYEAYIGNAIESVLNQQYENLECIVVDDGSTDHSLEIINDYCKKDSRVKLLSKTNGGLSSARNEGVKLAKGDYIAFLDSDDVWLDHKLQDQINKIQETGSDVVFSNSIFFENGKDLSSIVFNQRELLIYDFLASNPIPGCASNFMVSRTVFEKVGLFDNDLRSYEDLDFLFRLSLNGFTFVNVPNVAVKIRKHSVSMQTNFLKMFYNKSYAFDKWLRMISDQNFVLDIKKYELSIKKRFQSMVWTARDCRRKDLIKYCYYRTFQIVGWKFYFSKMFFKNFLYDLKLFLSIKNSSFK